MSGGDSLLDSNRLEMQKVFYSDKILLIDNCLICLKFTFHANVFEIRFEYISRLCVAIILHISKVEEL